MREFAIVVAVIPVMIGWILVWSGILHWTGVLPFGTLRSMEVRRESMKRLGKAKYIVVFGILGPGVAFALAFTITDFFTKDFHFSSQVIKFFLLAVFFGLFQGFYTWRNAFREPVPFPPDYPPMK